MAGRFLPDLDLQNHAIVAVKSGMDSASQSATLFNRASPNDTEVFEGWSGFDVNLPLHERDRASPQNDAIAAHIAEDITATFGYLQCRQGGLGEPGCPIGCELTV